MTKYRYPFPAKLGAVSALAKQGLSALLELVCDETGPPKRSLNGAPSGVSKAIPGHPPIA
jgi:hypothetical protein